jgi:ring-1,2-phenylacetyl-CoA epoxidase subunit PaaB
MTEPADEPSPAEPGGSGEPPDRNVYEVFVRSGVEAELQHVGSVRGSDIELAWQAAKEVFTRRERCHALWVVPRAAIYRGSDVEAVVLRSGTSRRYRLASFPSAHRRSRAKSLRAAETST